jgi:quercetin dioxygenase-like cupin family protein
MIPLHTHAREDECSYVLQGELTCYVGGEVVLTQNGSYVLKPRGVPHAFHNAGSETVRVIEILTPGGPSRATSMRMKRSRLARWLTRTQ